MSVLAAGVSKSEGLDIWGDLLEVIIWGTVAGVGLAIIFALTIRAFALENAARREGNRRVATAHAVAAFVGSAVSIAVVVAALSLMLHR